MRGKKWVEVVSIIITIVLFISTYVPVLATPLVTAQVAGSKAILSQTLSLDGSQSKWAESELHEAYDLGLTYPDVMKDFQKDITREEFCTVVVKLHEKLTGKTALPYDNPFTDTSNPEILKAYNLKIVKGTAPDKFSPTNKITRQEICVMIFRALEGALTELNKDSNGPFPFSDKDKIASWAEDAMKFAYKNQIMKGKSTTLIAPLDNTTREQGIVLIKRTFVQFSQNTQGRESLKATILLQDGKPPAVDDVNKFRDMNNSIQLAFPKYDARLKLYASTSSGKPSSLPLAFFGDLDIRGLVASLGGTSVLPNIKPIKPDILPDLPNIEPPIKPDILPDLPETLVANKPVPNGPLYSNADFSAFIDQEKDKKCWFAFELKDATGATKVVWQVSRAPFVGFKDNWKTPPGLVASGEVSLSQKEFSIDFGNFTDSIGSEILPSGSILLDGGKLPNTRTGTRYRPINMTQTVYYVRAVPVNSSGDVIGDPGAGLAILYGKKIVAENNPTKPGFELWTPMGHKGYKQPEFKDLPEFRTEAGFNPQEANNDRLFHFHGVDSSATRIVIQVSTEPFPGQGGGWPNTPNIVYEKSYNLPTTVFATTPSLKYGDDSTYPCSLLVPFGSFGKKASELKPGEYTKYYVRGVAIRPAIKPGTIDITYSQTMTINYGYEPPIQWYLPPSKYDKYEKVALSLPTLRMKNYTKVQWADKEALNHYYVFRKPTADEIKCTWKNKTTGKTLYPYDDFFGKEYYAALGIKTKEEYENKAIPEVLKVGTIVYFPPPDPNKDKPWYEELWDMVKEFFEDLFFVTKTIANQIADSYKNLKTGLIAYVVELCPVPSLKGFFKTALETMVNCGLAALGLPPTLPNFDDLTDMSLDYLAEVALTEAGVAPDSLTKEIVGEIGKQIGKEIEKSSSHEDYNPINSPFLKLNPKYQYRPAYVDVEISNKTALPTVPGSFIIDVTFTMDNWNVYDPVNGLFLVVDSKYVYGTTAGQQEINAYTKHFKWGLNGFTVNYPMGDKAVYHVFKPSIQKIPMILPGETRDVRVYLKPIYETSAMPNYPYGERLDYNDFANMYFYNGNKKFTKFELKGQFPSAEEYLRDKEMILDLKTDYYFANENYSDACHMLQLPVNHDW